LAESQKSKKRVTSEEQLDEGLMQPLKESLRKGQFVVHPKSLARKND